MSIESNTYKIIVVGEPCVGKTSLTQRYCIGAFSDNRKATIGVDFLSKELEVNGRKVKVELWDIAGQERFSSMTRSYFKDAHGAFVVCDKSSATTLPSVSKWKADIDGKVKYPDDSPIPAILLANKCDLPEACTVEVIQETAKELGFTACFETSAKAGIGFHDAVVELVKAIFEKIATQPQPSVVASSTTTLAPVSATKQNACSC